MCVRMFVEVDNEHTRRWWVYRAYQRTSRSHVQQDGDRQRPGTRTPRTPFRCLVFVGYIIGHSKGPGKRVRLPQRIQTSRKHACAERHLHALARAAAG